MRTVPLQVHQSIVRRMADMHSLTEGHLRETSAWHFKKQMQYLKEKHEIGFTLLLSLISNILFCLFLAVFCVTQLTMPGFVKYFIAGCFILLALLAASRLTLLFKRD